MIVDATERGHVAVCPRCGWESRAYTIADTAYAKHKTHQCEQDAQTGRKGPRKQ